MREPRGGRPRNKASSTHREREACVHHYVFADVSRGLRNWKKKGNWEGVREA